MFPESDRRNMNRSAVRSVFESLAANSLLLVIPSAFLLYTERFKLTALVCGAVFYFLCAKDKSVIPAVLILLLFLFPAPSGDTDIRQGRVIEIHRNYVIVAEGSSRILVYTKAMPVYDSVIAFDGVSEPLTDSKGFFRFPFARCSRLKGISCSVSPDTIVELRPSHSLRGLLMRRIRSFDPQTADILMEILFRFSSGEEIFSGLYKDRGISLVGIFAASEILLRYFCYDRTRKRIRFLLTLFLAVLYHMPYLIAFRLIREVLQAAGLKGKAKSGIAFLISLRLFPYVIFSASFLLPFVFAFAENGQRSSVNRMFFGMHATSILFHTVNPLELLFFQKLLPLGGFCWFAAAAEAVFRIPLHPVVLFADGIFSWLSLASMPGSLFGAGLPFYLLMQISLPRKYRQYTAAAVFLVFQMAGLFHPFAELSFINVGQGDSILIRAPFRSGDVLVDTGKPSQKNNVFAFLDSKGIQRLDTLLITHADNDHSGNMEAVTEAYHPRRLFTAHHEPFSAGMLYFTDINDIVLEDENESSIVTAFRLNGMDVLLMGDSSVNTEEQIIKRFPNIHADILKLSHHGSKTGNGEKFLNCVRPKIAVVSSGMYRIYHHPSPEVTERLRAKRIPYLDTKEEGDITFLCFPGFNLLLTASGKIAIIRV